MHAERRMPISQPTILDISIFLYIVGDHHAGKETQNRLLRSMISASR